VTPHGDREERLRAIIVRALEAPCASGALRAEWLARDLAAYVDGEVEEAEGAQRDLEEKVDELEERLEWYAAEHAQLTTYRDGVQRVLGAKCAYDYAEDAIADLVVMVENLSPPG
jgi:hypothetical protein